MYEALAFTEFSCLLNLLSALVDIYFIVFFKLYFFKVAT